MASRRNFITGSASLAASITFPVAATASAKNGADGGIIRAWERRKAAYFTMNTHPLIGTGDIAGNLAEERLWTAIDEAEEYIRTTPAETPHGIELQLWMALYHSTNLTHGEDNIVLRGDFQAIEEIESDLDWNARIIVAAIRSTRSMRAFR